MDDAVVNGSLSTTVDGCCLLGVVVVRRRRRCCRRCCCVGSYDDVAYRCRSPSVVCRLTSLQLAVVASKVAFAMLYVALRCCLTCMWWLKGMAQQDTAFEVRRERETRGCGGSWFGTEVRGRKNRTVPVADCGGVYTWR